MLAGMKPKLQKQIGFMDAYDMIKALKEMFRKQPRIQSYEVTKLLIKSKMAHGSSLDTHVFKMRSHIDYFEILGSPIPREFAVDMILGSLPPSFDWFITEYHKRWMDGMITELHKMLKQVEENMEAKVVINALMIERERELERQARPESWIKS